MARVRVFASSTGADWVNDAQDVRYIENISCPSVCIKHCSLPGGEWLSEEQGSHDVGLCPERSVLGQQNALSHGCSLWPASRG
uniref:DUF4033 domain-containing protein n=1 Tax=Thermomicrobium roseum TaxID=500 RepID=A0A7C1XPB5_THERO